MTDRRIKIRPDLSPGLAKAIERDAKRHKTASATHVVAVLAGHYGTPAPVTQQGFAADGGERARAKIKNPGRKPRPKE